MTAVMLLIITRTTKPSQPETRMLQPHLQLCTSLGQAVSLLSRDRKPVERLCYAEGDPSCCLWR